MTLTLSPRINASGCSRPLEEGHHSMSPQMQTRGQSFLVYDTAVSVQLRLCLEQPDVLFATQPTSDETPCQLCWAPLTGTYAKETGGNGTVEFQRPAESSRWPRNQAVRIKHMSKRIAE
jgi:hypothetical protein